MIQKHRRIEPDASRDALTSDMQRRIIAHKAICDSMHDTYVKKNHDYGDSFHLSYLEEGIAMSRIRLGDKFNRFKTLSKSEALVTDESICDTLLDLANYAIMTVLELRSAHDGA